jgi:uncharacterized RDD family membrane protein YckC
MSFTDLMSPPVVAACLWVLAATVTAFLPYRLQYPPGLMLLLLAPLILVWMGWQHGPWVALIATLGFVSMFRNPLIYLGRRALGLPARRPAERAEDGRAPDGTGRP